MRIVRSEAFPDRLLLYGPVMQRRFVGLCLLVIGGGATAGAVHNFTPGSGGYVVYGIINSLLATLALLGGLYLLASRSGFTIDRAAGVIQQWKSIAGLRSTTDHPLDECTAIELKRYLLLNRTRSMSAEYYCEIRLWTARGGDADIVLNPRMRDEFAERLATELAAFLDLPIERTKAGARGVVADD